MILHRLRAANALKYTLLDLSDLPEQGVILLTGPNESGKSTIGELICLALFGRTHALPELSIERAIRWGERELELEVEVTASDGHRWRVRRQINLEGDRSASMFCPATGTEHRGWRAVNHAVERLLGYGFDAFIESFYLARREIAPPHPRSETLKAMAGVLPLQTIADDLLTSVPELERRSGELGVELAELEERLQRTRRDDLLPPRPGPAPAPEAFAEEAAARRTQLKDARTRIAERMPNLQTGVDRLVDLLDGAPLPRWEARVEALEEALDDVESTVSWLGYPDVDTGLAALTAFHERVQQGLTDFRGLLDKARARRAWVASMLGEPGCQPIAGPITEDEAELEARRYSARALLRRNDGLALAGVVLLAAGLGLGFVPIAGLPDSVQMAGRGLAALAGALTAFFVVARNTAAQALRALASDESQLAARREALESDARQLTGVAERPLPDALAALRGLSGGALREDLQAFDAGAGGRLTRDGLKEKLQQAVAARMGEVQTRLESLRVRIGADIDELGRIHDLRLHRAALATSREEAVERLATYELAAELAQGAAKHLTHDFNTQVRQGLSRVLPSLTEGRYQYLQIGDDDLRVRVFSSDKQDFVHFEEISGGTQRQIELGTRIALSEALVRSTVGGQQFLFLDEPFAFFDEKRTRASMAALPRLSEQLPQIWIAAQSAPPGPPPDVHLLLRLERNELIDPAGE